MDEFREHVILQLA